MTEVSKSAFARHLGVSPARVSQYISQGLPVTWAGLVNIEAGVAWVLANVGTRSRRGRTKVRAEAEPPKRAGSYRTVGNKSQACRLFRITRGEFDRLVLEGMPVVSAPKNRGGEYVVDFGAVEDWLAEREAKRQEARRRYQEAERRREAEHERQIAAVAEWRRRKLLPGSMR
jgi:phage terminase Nu1 subunit (DNA packaging protein)